MTAQTSSPVAFSKNSDHLPLFALRMALLRSSFALLRMGRQPSPLPFLILSALLKTLPFSLISSFHQAIRCI